jgi:hypothetical protein
MQSFASLRADADGVPIILIPQITNITTASTPAIPIASLNIPTRKDESAQVVVKSKGPPSPGSGASGVYFGGVCANASLATKDMKTIATTDRAKARRFMLPLEG